MKTDSVILKRLYLVIGLCILVMAGVLAQLVRIQYGGTGRELLQGKTAIPTRIDTLTPPRGNILADDGNLLVTSMPIYEIRMDMDIVSDELFKENVEFLAEELAKTFGDKSASQYESLLTKAKEEGNQYFLIQRGVDHNTLQEIKDFPIWKEGRIKGGFLPQRQIVRAKPHRSLARRTLGKVSRNGARAVGIEDAYDEYLKGQTGFKELHKLSSGWTDMKNGRSQTPVSGQDVVTSIDIQIQQVAENELRRQLKLQDAELGSVVVMEVNTGYIKAISNLSKGSDGKYYESYNHAIGTKTHPGSTFKLLTLMALLESGKVKITDTVGAYGKYRFYRDELHDSRHGGYGRISVKEAFEVSSNVFAKMANDAFGDTPEEWVRRLQAWGVHEPSGIKIAGEATPSFRTLDDTLWSGITIPWSAVGYEFEMTPLQILGYYNAIANNGVMMHPQLVKRIEQNGKIIQEFDPEVTNPRLCSPRTIIDLRACLEGVVEKGTGKKLQTANFKIAGKTGTAQMQQGSSGYGEDGSRKYQASFVGYFPADNPIYSCIVTIQGPTKDIYGAKVSGTVFKAVADKVYSTSFKYHEHINQGEKTHHYDQAVIAGKNDQIRKAALLTGQKVDVPNSEWSHNPTGELQPTSTLNGVPDVRGMGLVDALDVLENAGYTVSVKGSGRVTHQSITPHTDAPKGSRITLTLKRW